MTGTTERKGQHLFNEIANRYGLTSWQVKIVQIGNEKNHRVIPVEFLSVELHNILFQMSDKEFDDIMSTIGDKGRHD